MFLQRLIETNPAIAMAAAQLHQEGRVVANTYLVDLEVVEANAHVLSDAASASGMKAYFMAKQYGRNPDVSRAVIRGGIPSAVCVDVQGLRAHVRNGIRIGHVGHLVQPHRGAEAFVIAARPEVVTLFSLDGAERLGREAISSGRLQDVLLRVHASGDHFYFGHGGGFPLGGIEDAARAVDRVGGLRVAGVTTFPCVLADAASRSLQPTHNLQTLQEAARRLRAVGFELTQVNGPGTNTAATMELLAMAGVTHVEPGNALHGTTPQHVFAPSAPELPAIVYVSEISHVTGGDAYLFAAGYYIDRVLGDYEVTALCGRDDSILERRFPVEFAGDGAIHYYAIIREADTRDIRVGDSVVFCFRPQTFVTRSRTQGIESLHGAGPIRLCERYDQEGGIIDDPS